MPLMGCDPSCSGRRGKSQSKIRSSKDSSQTSIPYKNQVTINGKTKIPFRFEMGRKPKQKSKCETCCTGKDDTEDKPVENNSSDVISPCKLQKQLSSSRDSRRLIKSILEEMRSTQASAERSAQRIRSAKSNKNMVVVNQQYDTVLLQSITISTVMLLAIKSKNIPQKYLRITQRYLKSVQVGSDIELRNIKKLLWLINLKVIRDSSSMSN